MNFSPGNNLGFRLPLFEGSYAVIDQGTNTMKVTAVEYDDANPSNVLNRDSFSVPMEIRSGASLIDVKQRFLFVLDEVVAFLRIIPWFRVDLVSGKSETKKSSGNVKGYATEAFRNGYLANRGDEILYEAEKLGIPFTVLSDRDEGYYTYHGVCSVLAEEDATLLDYPLLVMDIGGGSTELIFGVQDKAPRMVSLKLGVPLDKKLFQLNDYSPESLRAACLNIQTQLVGVKSLTKSFPKTLLLGDNNSSTMALLRQLLLNDNQPDLYKEPVALTVLEHYLSESVLKDKVPELLKQDVGDVYPTGKDFIHSLISNLMVLIALKSLGIEQVLLIKNGNWREGLLREHLNGLAA